MLSNCTGTAKLIDNPLRPIEPSTLTSFLERHPVVYTSSIHTLTSYHKYVKLDRMSRVILDSV